MRLEALAGQYPRYGYQMLHEILEAGRAGDQCQADVLHLSPITAAGGTKPRKRLPREVRLKRVVAMESNQRWSMDFMTDQLVDGRRFRILNIVDDYTRQCRGQIVDFSISGSRLARFLDQLAKNHRLPQEIVVDNGPELTSRAMFSVGREGAGSTLFH